MQKEFLSVLGGLLSSAVSGKNGESQGKIENRTVELEPDNFHYHVHVPPDFQSGKKYPLIVFLHGIGQRGSGGFLPQTGAASSIARHYLAQVPAVILLPQCRSGSYWSDSVMEEMVMREIAQTTEEFGANAERIYLTGVSMGGYGVWHLAAKFPEKFAALVSICGGSSIIKGDRFSPIAERVGKIPAWLFHGADDRVVPVSESREIVKALKATDGSVKYSEYAGVGHNVWMNALGEKDLMPWLFAQHL